MSIKILLLEDDLLFCESLEDFLDEEGFDVTTAHNPNQALEHTYDKKFDLYLLDINLPIMSGLEFLDSLRQSGDETPTIFLTSYQDKEVMKEGFLKGCDDYIKKPVDLEELHLRILSLMKRTRGDSIQCVDDICIDIEQKRVFKDNVELEVSLREFELLTLFIKNKGSVVSKEAIMDSLWAHSQEGSEGAVRVYINRLKKILGSEHFINVRGVGYKYES